MHMYSKYTVGVPSNTVTKGSRFSSPCLGEFCKWHPGWGQENQRTFFYSVCYRIWNEIEKEAEFLSSAPCVLSDLQKARTMSATTRVRKTTWDGSHRDNFGEILEILSAVESQSRVFQSIGPSLWISLAHKTPTYNTLLPKVFLIKQCL